MFLHLRRRYKEKPGDSPPPAPPSSPLLSGPPSPSPSYLLNRCSLKIKIISKQACIGQSNRIHSPDSSCPKLPLYTTTSHDDPFPPFDPSIPRPGMSRLSITREKLDRTPSTPSTPIPGNPFCPSRRVSIDRAWENRPPCFPYLSSAGNASTEDTPLNCLPRLNLSIKTGT